MDRYRSIFWCYDLGVKRDDDWVEPEPPQPPDINRGVRRLAQAVLVQAVSDFKTIDRALRQDAEQFLYPGEDRYEDLRGTVEVSAVGP
jgi:hypothetical protein